MASKITACAVDEIFGHSDFKRLTAECEAECANKNLSAVAPDRMLYKSLEASGLAACFMVADGAALQGFALVLLSPSAHNSRRYATVESLFVARDARAGGAGTGLMETIEVVALQAECEAVFYSTHVGTQLARMLFLCSDRYTLTNYVFCRRLA